MVLLIEESDCKGQFKPKTHPHTLQGLGALRVFGEFADRWLRSRAQNEQETQRQIRLVSPAPYGPKGLRQLTV